MRQQLSSTIIAAQGMQMLQILGAIIDLPHDVPEDSLPWFESRPFAIPSYNWNAQLPDETPVSLLSIPGTHDSASYAAKLHQFRRCSKCQKWKIYEQLRAGIRYLDMRVRAEGEIKMAHGEEITLNSLQEEIGQVELFLKENPSEFVIMAFQKDGGEQWDPSDKVEDHFYIAAKNPEHNKDKLQAYFSNSVPTVGQLRGKVWLLKGWRINFNNKTMQLSAMGFEFEHFPTPQDLNSHVFVQNTWNVDCDFTEFKGNQYVSIEEKANRVLQTAFLVPSSPQRFKVNFLSGAGPILPHKKVVYPYILASAQNGPNCQLNQALKRQQNQQAMLGITLMDFPGYDLINSIIQTNFKSQKWQKWQKDQKGQKPQK